MTAPDETVLIRYEWNYGGMEDVPDGDFIVWEDYATLADRVRSLEEALLEWDALIKHQYHGSREAMTDMTIIAQKTAALLKLGAWSDTRAALSTPREETTP